MIAGALKLLDQSLFNRLKTYFPDQFFPVLHFHKYIGPEITITGLQGADAEMPAR